MAGLFSSVGLVLMLELFMHIRSQRAVFLGMTVWATLIATSSPAAADELDTTYHPMGFLGDSPSSTGSTLSNLPASYYTASESSDLPGSLPTITETNHETRTDIMLAQWGHVPSEHAKSFAPSEILADEPQPLSTPSFSPSEPAFGSSPQFEAPAKLPLDWKLASIKSTKQSSSLFVTPTRPQLQSQSNISVTQLSPSTSGSATPQLSLTSEYKPLDAKLAVFRNQQEATSEQTVATIPSQPVDPHEPLNLAFADSPADESYLKIFDVNQLSPSSLPLGEKKPVHSINMLPKAEDILSPSYNVPFIAPNPSSPLSEPTEAPPEDFYPTNSMELDWGSGDYVETMSILNSDGNDYSLVTKVPSDSYDQEEYTEHYDTSFPSRVGIPLLSMPPPHHSPSPSLMTAYSTIVPLKSVHPSSFSSTIHYTMAPTPIADSDIPDISDIDWADTFTIQPTDVLLPDMNSLEYYTIQLTKENNSSDTAAEQRGNVTMVSISTTVITPTSNVTNDAKWTEEETFSDQSGFEPHDDSTIVVTTEESPQLLNVSEPSIDPSRVPNHFFDTSSSIWGGKASTTDWSAPTHTVGLESTVLTHAILPTTTPLLPDDLISSSSMTDVNWFVTDSSFQSPQHTTPVLVGTISSSSAPIDSVANTTAGMTELAPQDSTSTTEETHSITLVLTEAMSNVTLGPPRHFG
ncbi:mucin-5AC-like [Echeneis naucrates]|uniref:mucin-5AC-like n=1 Tax=Echeneis naucrates TaxID=173247 RepID=UPI001113A42A|nr:mucin-5AC-like [Echeneis naucrates]